MTNHDKITGSDPDRKSPHEQIAIKQEIPESRSEYNNPLPSLSDLASRGGSALDFRSKLASVNDGEPLTGNTGAETPRRKLSRDFSGDDMTSPRPIGRRGDLYYCHLCTYIGMTKDEFDDHMGTHFDHTCPYCDYTSRTEGRLKRHIKDFHATDEEYDPKRDNRSKVNRCRHCGFASDDQFEFWTHQRTHIKDDKMLQCPKCPFVTEYKHHLEYHLRNHFGSKPYKCDKCNYACVNKSMLNSHSKSHTNVYQYRCSDCTYATKYCHSLKLHLKKYDHKAATVLNADGSLPTDGSGDFDLVSKRGPPRGPRGPRKEKTPSPPTTTMPTQSMPGPPPLPPPPPPGSLMPGLWPFPPGIPPLGFQSPHAPPFGLSPQAQSGSLQMWAIMAAASQHAALASDNERTRSLPESLSDGSDPGCHDDRFRGMISGSNLSMEAENLRTGEYPLDLTKSGTGSSSDEDFGSSPNKPAKRTASESEEEEEELTLSSPRKRSRKGKAYKLDSLLQLEEERAAEEESRSQYDDEDAEISEAFATTEDDVPPTAETKCSPVNYADIHRRLAELNGDPRRTPDHVRYTQSSESRRAEMDREVKRGRLECAHCGIAFKDSIMFTMHMGYHGFTDPFKCNMCGHQSPDKVDFFLHIARVAHN